jgi:7-cyano-7-deazaguanine synthase
MSEILLLSGGIDSVAIAAWRRPSLCLTVDYGQRPALAEVRAAIEVCRHLGLMHEIIRLPIENLGSGVLAGREGSSVSPHAEFWPFRNQLLLTIGAMCALRHTIQTVIIGTVSTDRRHVDGSEKFIQQIAALISMQEGSVEIVAPALHLSSLELIAKSKIEPSVLGWAHSCHSGNLACGGCPGCGKHSETMRAIGWER